MVFSAEEIVGSIQGRIINTQAIESSLGEIRVHQLSSLRNSKQTDAAFFFSQAFQGELTFANPGILVTGEAFAKPLERSGLPLWKSAAIISCKDPYLAMARLTEKFAAFQSTTAHLAQPQGEASEIHPSAVLASSVELGKGVRIGPHCVIEDSVQIGSNTVIYPGCYIGPGCRLGESCVLFPRVTLYEWTQLGNRVRIHAGSVLGADGFGYAPIIEDGQVIHHQKIYHLGRVVIGDEVEIGANTCIDRATFGETRVEQKAKIDNLVQAGHNAHIGEGAVICGTVSLAGSSKIGKYVYVGGAAGVSNQVEVGDRAKIGGMALVTKDVPPEGNAVGNPQRTHQEHFRAHALLNKLLRQQRRTE